MTNLTEKLWKEFGAWYQKTREASAFTQEDVSKETGLNVKTISRIENGEPTKRNTVVKLAQAISANVEEALDRAGFSVPNIKKYEKPKNAQELLEILQAHGLKIPMFANGLKGLEKVGEDELNEVLENMLFSLGQKAKKHINDN